MACDKGITVDIRCPSVLWKIYWGISLGIVLMGMSYPAGGEDDAADSLYGAAEKVTIATYTGFGISVFSLRWLLDADNKSVFLYDNLEKKGEIPYIRQLDDAGYVRMQIIEGKDKYLMIIPTELGIKIRKALSLADGHYQQKRNVSESE